MNLTDIMNSINWKKNDLSENPDFKNDYNAYIVDRCVSNCQDTAPLASQLNRYDLTAKLPDTAKYLFYLNSIRPRKRFGKFYKKSKTSDIIRAIMEFYEVSERVAIEYDKILTDEQKKTVMNSLSKGGT